MYFTDIESKPTRLTRIRHVYETIIGTKTGATVPITMNNKRFQALIDTGATRSCVSENCYASMFGSPLRTLYGTEVRSATGNSLKPLGVIKENFTLGNHRFGGQFIVCKNLTRSVILGLDFLRHHRIGTSWNPDGTFALTREQETLVQSVSVYLPQPQLVLRQEVTVPSRSMVILNADLQTPPEPGEHLYEVVPNTQLVHDHPNLVALSTLHCINSTNIDCIPFPLINLEYDDISLRAGQPLAILKPSTVELNQITTSSVYENVLQFTETVNEVKEPVGLATQELDQVEKGDVGKRFITSPADVEGHRKVNLQDAPVSKEHRQKFKDLCTEYQDVFSTSSTDIGRTKLITMDIDTGDSPPICQKPYNLPLKHAAWVQKELETLEKAGVIVRSVSPWASPIVVVPKRSAPDEPPRRRLCVDYRALNSLLPPVKKAYSNAKGVLTLVPLPKIDEIYGRLRGSKIYSTFDLRSGYYHMALSEESRPKSAFVTPLGKFEFVCCPFGLAQAPAYFQALILQVLSGLDFAFGYLDDILIFSPDTETHLKHLDILFQRLREAGLKLKESKCNFLKAHVQYLGHLVSGEGIEPLAEKLESMKDMPSPTNPREVKQFLGLVGYYRKFIARFADIARPLTSLTRKDVEFVWTTQCQEAFQWLKEALMETPILKYPDPDKPYTLYTDASKFAWACVLTQEYEHEHKGKTVKIQHPITYQSGLFRGSQINWAALTKEAYAIYMSVKKLAYYLEDAEITLRSDHLPLKKFLKKNTLNSKVNNWAIEISPFRIHFEYIKGIKNTLADTMSRLVKMDPTSELKSEPPGYEFGYYCFDPLPGIETSDRDINISMITSSNASSTGVPDPLSDRKRGSTLPLPDEELQAMQNEDEFCSKIKAKFNKGILTTGKPYYLSANGILHRYVNDGKQRFETIVLPRQMAGSVLRLGHDQMGHNGITRTYMLLRRMYFWKGMKPFIEDYIRQCPECQKITRQVVKYPQLHFDAPSTPMEFLSMDLIGEFHPPSAQGHRYALTVICMLTGYTWCIPLKTKTASEVVRAYIDRVYSEFGGSLKILSDNGTEFKNALFEEVAQQLGVEYKIYTAPYHPQSNGRIEGYHSFLKACISKHVAPGLEWDQIIPLATAAYNFFPNEHSRESPFFLMFGRDPYVPLSKLLQPKVRYLGNDDNILSLEALKNIYQLVAENLKKARDRQGLKFQRPFTQPLKPGDLVLIKDHTAGTFEPRYVGEFRIVSKKGQQYEIRPTKGGHTRMVHMTHVKYVLPAENIINKLPDYQAFGRKSTLRLNPDHIPDLQWSLSTSRQTIFSAIATRPADSVTHCSVHQNITNCTGSVDLAVSVTPIVVACK